MLSLFEKVYFCKFIYILGNIYIIRNEYYLCRIENSDAMKIEIKRYYLLSEWIDKIEPSHIYIVKCNRGVAELSTHLENTTLSHGVGFIIDGNERIDIISESKDVEIVVYKITYNIFYELIFELNNDIFKALWSNKTNIVDKEYLAMANNFLEQIETIYNKDGYSSSDKVIANLLQCYFLDIYEHIKSVEPQVSITNANQKRDRIIKLHNLAHQHKVRDIDFYSQKLNISSRTLYSATQEVLGLSPKEVINSIVISDIKNTLQRTTLSNHQIADMYGFSDLSSFSQYFKRAQGISPTLYRNSINGNNGNNEDSTSCECSICSNGDF